MKTSSLILVIVLCATAHEATSQTLFESAEGETSIKLPYGGFAGVNTADKSFSLSYFHRVSDKKPYIGFDAKAKAKDGFAPLFKGDKLSPDAKVGLNFGFAEPWCPGGNCTFDVLNFNIDWTGAKAKFLDKTAIYEDQVKSEVINDFSVGIAYNILWNGNFLFGISPKYVYSSNRSELEEITLLDQSILSIDSTGSSSRSFKDEYSAYDGALKYQSSYRLNADFVYIPDALGSRILFSAFSRNHFGDKKPKFNAGFGAFLNQKVDEGEKDELFNPMKIIGGVIVEFDDIGNSKNKDTQFYQRSLVGIVVGYYID